MGREIREAPLIAAVNPSGNAAAGWTAGTSTRRMSRDDDLIRPDRDAIDKNAGRQKPGCSASLTHDLLPLATSCDQVTAPPNLLHRD
jgi:hypothetical protein